MNKNTILSPQRHDDTASNIQRQTCNQSPLWLISMIHNGINNRGNGDHRRIPDHSAKPLRSSASSVVNINEQHSLRSWFFCGSIVVHNLANCGRCWWPGCERLQFMVASNQTFASSFNPVNGYVKRSSLAGSNAVRPEIVAFKVKPLSRVSIYCRINVPLGRRARVAANP